jgi:hypothetical protein
MAPTDVLTPYADLDVLLRELLGHWRRNRHSDCD